MFSLATAAFSQQLMTGITINRKATSFLAVHWVYKYILISLLVILAPPLLIGKITCNQHVQNEWANATKLTS